MIRERRGTDWVIRQASGGLKISALAAAALLGAAGGSRAANPVVNGGFEEEAPPTKSHYVQGWMNYGLPLAHARVDSGEQHDGKQALRIGKGGIFCYEIPIDLDRDYLLSFWAKASDAAPEVEASPPGKGKLAVPGLRAATTFDWKRFEVKLPASERPVGTRDLWISLGATPTKPGGVVFFDDVRLQAAGSTENRIPNPSFEGTPAELVSPPGWTTVAYGAQEGAAAVSLDRGAFHEGSGSLRVDEANTSTKTRVTQDIDIQDLRDRGVNRIRVSVWGKCSGMGNACAKADIYGLSEGNVEILSLTGDQGWTRGEAVIDLSQLESRNPAIWLHAPNPAGGTFWFDDVRIEEMKGGETVNLFRNSGFTKCSSNPRLPNYWGIWGNPTMTIKDWSWENFGIDEQAETPVAGTRVLKMFYPPPGHYVPVPPAEGITFYVGQQWARRPLPGEYTLSVYLKAERDGTVLKVEHPAIGTGTQWRLGKDWRRYSCTSSKSLAMFWFLLPEADSKIWMAAPQLEAGPVATDYRPAPGEGSTPSLAKPPPDLEKLPGIAAVTTEKPPRIDGLLTDDCWAQAQQLSDFKLVDGAAPSQQTEAFVVCDTEALYIAVRCNEPELAKLRAYETRRDSQVFADDSVEIFLSPTERPDPYYHFAVNTAGVQWDAINLGQREWDAEWQVKTGREKTAWTAELRIPFSAFPAQKGSSNWRFNIGRTRFVGHQDGERSAWAPISQDKGFHDSTYFASLRGIPAAGLKESPAERPRQDSCDGNLLAGLLASDGSLEAYAEYDFYTDEAKARAVVRWRKPEAAVIRITLIDAATGAVVNPEPTDIEFPGGNQRAGVLSDGPRPVCGPAEREVEIPLAHLPAGRYEISASALVGGAEVATSKDLLVKLPKGPMEVRLNRFTRGMEVDGKGFYPISLPTVVPSRTSDWALHNVKDAGFNTICAPIGIGLPIAEISAQGISPELEKKVRGQLDRVHALGYKVLFAIAWDLTGWERQRELFEGDIDRLAEVYARVVETFKDHPAIIAWFWTDEPSSRDWVEKFGYQEKDMQVMYDTVRKADPYRPTYVNYNHSWKTEPFGGLACTDIVSHDNYVISNDPFDLELLVPTVRMVNDKRSGRKPAFGWISGSFDDCVITPGPDPVRVHAWLHLVYGTRGLCYFGNRPMNNDVWDVMKTFNRESEILSAKAFSPPTARPLAVASHNQRIHYCIWENDGKAYLFGVNTGGVPVGFKVDIGKSFGLSLSGGRRLFDEGPLDFDDGVLNDEFTACGRRAYVFDLDRQGVRPPQPPSEPR